MRTLLLTVLLAGLGCRSDRVSGAASDLVLGARTVRFPRTFVGHPTTARLELRNVGKPPREVAIEAEAPFSTTSAAETISGGASLELTLRFAPTAPGDFEGTVRLTSEDAALTATLLGSAEAIPSCPPRGPCWVASFDVATEACVDEKVADGLACAQADVCLTDTQCVDGECAGKAISCDDGDACTTDTCDPRTGCVHFASTGRCSSSLDPCQVPFCDRDAGCTFVEAQDGIACGPADCSSARICLFGACTLVPVSDGAACGEASPCQPRGRCQAGACQQPAPVELRPEWTIWAAPGRGLSWDSIADEDHNLYWREYEPGGLGGWLVSVTRRGFPRFSVPVMQASQMALVEDVLLLRRGSAVEARSATDGGLVWRRDFRAGPGADTTDVRTLARGPPGTAYLGLNELVVPPDGGVVYTSGTVLLQLELRRGATRWEVRLPGQQLDDQTTPVDEAGYLYVGTMTLGTGERRYVGLTPLGAVRWDVANPHAAPAAVFGGRVYHWDHWLSETSTGAWVNASPPTLSVAGYPRLALGAVSYAGNTTSLVPDCANPGSGALTTGTAMQLVRVDPPTSQQRWSLEIAGADGGGLAMTNTVLTSRATIVFSQAEDYCGLSRRHVLREVSAFGQPVFSCRLPAPESYWGEGLLDDGLWVSAVSNPAGQVGVRAFALPGFELPEHGWATAWGSPARDAHSR